MADSGPSLEPPSLGPESGNRATSRAFAFQVAALLLLWLTLSLPLALGRETLYFRDVFTTHLPLKAFGAEALRNGEVPALNPTWALGQPYRGNPNAVPLYPGNVLYLWLPFWSAFNLHYALHWLLAGFGMFLLARRLGRSREAALLAALTYAGSGWMLAALTFYNLLIVVAWWPLVILATVAESRAAVALGGLACGMALLGGEPVTALLGVVPLLALACRRHGLLRGAARAVAVGTAGLIIALPQLLATARVNASASRVAHGLTASQASYFALRPVRLLELVLPHPFGLPGWEGPLGTVAAGVLDHLPFFFSIHFGLVALVLALSALRRHRLLAALAGVSLVLAWLGGLSGRMLLAASGGLFRSPEKLLFWLALALPLLAAAGLDRRRRETSAGRAGWLLVAAALAGIAAVPAFAVGQSALSALSAARIAPAALAAQGRQWCLGLAVAGLLLAGTWWLLAMRRAQWLVALQLLGLLQLAPLWMTDDVARYRGEAPSGPPSDESAVVLSQLAYPPWHGVAPPAHLPPGPPRSRARWLAARMAPAPGVLSGKRYPLAPDLEGMHHLFYNLLEVEMAQAPWTERLRWLEVLGVDTLVTSEPLDGHQVRETREIRADGERSLVYRLAATLPAAWWPPRIEVAPTPAAAFDLVARSPSGDLPGVVPYPIEHHAGGRVTVEETDPDRVRLDVESGGGLLVVQRSYQPLWRARAGDVELPVLPADLALVGILVPPGRHRVILEVAPDHLKSAGLAASGAALALLLYSGWETRRRSPAV